MSKLKIITLDGVDYIRKDSIKQKAEKVDGLECVMVRTLSAGVHFGYLKERNGKEVTLINSKRVYFWSGACSLSQLAMDGTNSPDNCKITLSVDNILLTEAIEVISMSAEAVANLYSVAEWKK